MKRLGRFISRGFPVIAVTALVVLGLSGCGAGNRPYPVHGKVLYEDGSVATDLAGRLIVFTSDELKVSAQGVIKPDGSYSLYSLKPGDGAFPGRYKVTVAPPEPEGQEKWQPEKRPPAKSSRPRLDSRLENPDTTPLEETVQAATNEINLSVNRAR